ncbi:tetratricopeptide repeat protein, partial [Actinophytocola sp.]|uniref:tetratricopeptide repeat protein n=1 Tax=Actinophytocola sp. TaxID=1872138 RepID=UPI002D80C571
SYRHLPADAGTLFRRLGCHPGADLDAPAAAALAGVDLDEVTRLLDLLVRAHMVRRDPGGRYGMHDLLRAYALDLAMGTDTGADLHAARTRLFDHYLEGATEAVRVLYPTAAAGEVPQPQGDPERLRAWLAAELPNLVAVCEYAAGHDWPGHAVRLAATLYRYLESGHYAEALAIHGAALAAARSTGDRAGEAQALTNLGLVHRLLGQYGPATERLTRALELHRLSGDQAGAARTLSNLGIVADRLGAHAAAKTHLEQALTAYRELGNRHGIAAVLTNLGGLCGSVGQHARAAEHLTEAHDLFAALGDRSGAASALANLGEAETNLGGYTRAAGHLEQARVLFEELGHRYGQAIALSNLGPVHSRLGEHDRALADLEQALAIFRDTGHRYGEASVLNGLGEALHAAGRPGALDRHTAALAIATETGDRDERTRAQAGIARAEAGRYTLSRNGTA